mmetsp:Transcript_20260/g.64080  ORF Transcript_20260/g.64080 Transcript_20260/m.64080 type:complete len:263 (-) Transcript_20260:2454-3242(-)
MRSLTSALPPRFLTDATSPAPPRAPSCAPSAVLRWLRRAEGKSLPPAPEVSISRMSTALSSTTLRLLAEHGRALRMRHAPTADVRAEDAASHERRTRLSASWPACARRAACCPQLLTTASTRAASRGPGHSDDGDGGSAAGAGADRIEAGPGPPPSWTPCRVCSPAGTREQHRSGSWAQSVSLATSTRTHARWMVDRAKDAVEASPSRLARSRDRALTRTRCLSRRSTYLCSAATRTAGSRSPTRASRRTFSVSRCPIAPRQ